MRIVAVTACLTGIAHTYLAAEVLEKHARELCYDIKVETQGALGIENRITDEEAKEADVVILTNDIEIEDVERFKDKPVISVAIGAIIMKPGELFGRIKKYK